MGKIHPNGSKRNFRHRGPVESSKVEYLENTFRSNLDLLDKTVSKLEANAVNLNHRLMTMIAKTGGL